MTCTQQETSPPAWLRPPPTKPRASLSPLSLRMGESLYLECPPPHSSTLSGGFSGWTAPLSSPSLWSSYDLSHWTPLPWGFTCRLPDSLLDLSLEGRGTWGTRSPGTSVWGTLLPSPTCPTPVSPSGLNSTVSSLLKCVHLFHPSGVSLCSVVPAEASWQDSHRTILIILPPVLAGLSPHRMVTSWSRVRFCSQLYVWA